MLQGHTCTRTET